jgi:hypothetical protein
VVGLPRALRGLFSDAVIRTLSAGDSKEATSRTFTAAFSDSRWDYYHAADEGLQ